jgi:hypothetical protein
MLKNGRKVGGWFGGKSFASSYPNTPELYLEEAYHINADGGFDEPFQKSDGILITESEISTIEFFKPDWSNEDEQQETNQRRLSAKDSGERIPASTTEASGQQGDGGISADNQ